VEVPAAGGRARSARPGRGGAEAAGGADRSAQPVAGGRARSVRLAAAAGARGRPRERRGQRGGMGERESM
jgi:hypothetical protein